MVKALIKVKVLKGHTVCPNDYSAGIHFSGTWSTTVW